ncbi:MAG: hypothetical protein PVI39_07745 [Desulfobacteraceae bacterium]|jgi:hypothetical protein
MARLVEVLDSLTFLGGTYENVLTNKDFTPIEPDMLKYYAPEVGVVLGENYAKGERLEQRTSM